MSWRPPRRCTQPKGVRASSLTASLLSPSSLDECPSREGERQSEGRACVDVHAGRQQQLSSRHAVVRAPPQPSVCRTKLRQQRVVVRLG